MTSSSRILGLVSTILSLVSTTLATPQSQQPSPVEGREQSTCHGTHIFLARGYNEEYPGRQKALVHAICSGLSSNECGYEEIIFDDMEGSVYGTAVHEGVMAGKSQITSYVEECPDSKFVLSGYSLGAHVVGDILGGNGGDFTMYNTVEPEVDGLGSAKTSPGNHRQSISGSADHVLLEEPRYFQTKQTRRRIVGLMVATVAAVLVFGDTRHTAGQSYNVGSGADKNSCYPRSGAVLEKVGAFSPVLRSYCAFTDPVCA